MRVFSFATFALVSLYSSTMAQDSLYVLAPDECVFRILNMELALLIPNPRHNISLHIKC